MTIEIRQLVIRARAEARPEVPERRSEPPDALQAPTPARPETVQSFSRDDREAIVAACVREVLRELRKSRER
jgi:hypothetical protein